MQKDDWLKARNKQSGERERRELDHEESVARFLRIAEQSKKKKATPSKKKVRRVSTKRRDRTSAFHEKARQSRVVEPVPSCPGTIFEPMICLDCETTYTTDDTHIRLGAKVLCIKCEGRLCLLHQYEADREELDSRLTETLASVL